MLELGVWLWRSKVSQTLADDVQVLRSTMPTFQGSSSYSKASKSSKLFMDPLRRMSGPVQHGQLFLF